MADASVAPVDPVDRREIPVAFGIAFGVFVVLNALFYVLSDRYFADRVALHGPTDPDVIQHTRIAFAATTLVASQLAAAAWVKPRWIAYPLTGLLSLTAIIGGFASFAAGFHGVLGTTLVLLGLIGLVLLWRAHTAGSRAAWAFVASSCGVLSVITLFGSTKIRNAFGVGLWDVMILPLLFAIATVALVRLGGAFRDRS